MGKTGYSKATKTEILKYSFGGLGSNIGFMMAMTYLMFFYTDVCGISPAVVASLFLIARIVDAVTDPMMGVIADRTNSKLGKFRPWIIYGAPLLGINIAVLFAAPNLSETGKIIYIYIVYIMYSLTSTAVNIPYHSLTPVMTEDPNQRTIVATAKSIMAIPANLLVMVATLPLVKIFGGGKKGWLAVAILFGIITVVAFWICASGAKSHDTPREPKKGNEPNIPLKQQLKLIFNNKPLLLLMTACGTTMIAFAISNTVNMYYMIYNIKRQDLIPIIGLVGILLSVPVAFAIPKLAKKYGKKKLYLYGSFLSIIPSFLLTFTPYNNVTLVVVLSVLTTVTTQIPGITVWAMLPDCVEYGEWKLGFRGEGTVSSSLTFINKLGMAIGGLCAGLILGAVGYVANQQQTETVLNAILYMKTLLPAVASAIGIIVMKNYPITNEFYAKMLSEIDERKQKCALGK